MSARALATFKKPLKVYSPRDVSCCMCTILWRSIWSHRKKPTIDQYLETDRGRLRVRDLTSSFFAYSQNIDLPVSFILPFFTGRVSIVIFSEEGYALSRSQNDKTFNIWYLVFATTTFARKLVVGWQRLPRFLAKVTLAHARDYLVKSRTRSGTLSECKGL